MEQLIYGLFPSSKPSELWPCESWRRSLGPNRPALKTTPSWPSWRLWRLTKTLTRRWAACTHRCLVKILTRCILFISWSPPEFKIFFLWYIFKKWCESWPGPFFLELVSSPDGWLGFLHLPPKVQNMLHRLVSDSKLTPCVKVWVVESV